MEVRDKKFEEILVGDRASFIRLVTDEDISRFAALSGDYNPLHTDSEYAAGTSFKRPLVHGMFVGALCSTLVGMHLPGKQCLYLRQTLSFMHPVFAGDTLLVEGTVTEKVESQRLLSIEVSVSRDGTEVLQGTAAVQVRV